MGRADIRRRIRAADLVIALIAAVLATGIGLQQLWLGKPFGTPLDYLFALAWASASTSPVFYRRSVAVREGL